MTSVYEQETTSKTELNVLYACDENYAPFAGVSMTSLFMSNRDLDRIRVYLVLDNVSEHNQAKYRELAQQYGREVVLIDAKDVVEKIKSLNIPMYRGSYTTNFRLFFSDYIQEDLDKLLYLDCDTLVVGSLKTLVQMDMGDNWLAMVYGSMLLRRDKIFDYKAPYNAGVLLINVKQWKQSHVAEKLLEHTVKVRSQYVNPDQDLLNIVCDGHILRLTPEYNFAPIHRTVSDKIYYREAPVDFYTPQQIQNAREHPIILHTYRFLGEFPWHEGSLHPDVALFDKYLRESLWKDYQKKPASQAFLFRAERLFYRVLPRSWFFWAINTAQYWSFKKQEKKLRKQLKQGEKAV